MGGSSKTLTKTVMFCWLVQEDDAKVKRAFQTLLTYMGNVAKNPDEEKFRKIRLTNQTFQVINNLHKNTHLVLNDLYVMIVQFLTNHVSWDEIG